jgi:hypothetical protein
MLLLLLPPLLQLWCFHGRYSCYWFSVCSFSVVSLSLLLPHGYGTMSEDANFSGGVVVAAAAGTMLLAMALVEMLLLHGAGGAAAADVAVAMVLLLLLLKLLISSVLQVHPRKGWSCS